MISNLPYITRDRTLIFNEMMINMASKFNEGHKTNCKHILHYYETHLSTLTGKYTIYRKKRSISFV